MPTEAFGARVRRLRQGKGLSQDALARHLEMSRQRVFEIEKQDTPGVRTDTLERLAEALGTTSEYLLRGDQPSELSDLPFEAYLRTRGEISDEKKRRVLEETYRMLVELEDAERERLERKG